LKRKEKTVARKPYQGENIRAEKFGKKYRKKAKEGSGEYISVSGPIKPFKDLK
jgi:hypothetical protein